MINYYILFALIQAATEFLPVSSSGHLLFFKGVFRTLDIPVFFDVIVHFGSVIAIIIFYRKRLTHICSECLKEASGKTREKRSLNFIFYIVISTIVTGIIYFFAKDTVEYVFSSPSFLPVTYGFTTLLLLMTYIKPTNIRTVFDAPLYLPVIVGIFQGLALFPGVSRSGATIAILLFLGIASSEAAFYSFTLAIPAIIGGTVIDAMDASSIQFFQTHMTEVFLGFTVSLIFSYLFLYLLDGFLKRGRFWYFSFYTAAMAVAALLLF